MFTTRLGSSKSLGKGQVWYTCCKIVNDTHVTHRHPCCIDTHVTHRKHKLCAKSKRIKQATNILQKVFSFYLFIYLFLPNCSLYKNILKLNNQKEPPLTLLNTLNYYNIIVLQLAPPILLHTPTSYYHYWGPEQYSDEKCQHTVKSGEPIWIIFHF